MEISDKVLIQSGLKEDPSALAEEAEVESDVFTEADEQPIALD